MLSLQTGCVVKAVDENRPDAPGYQEVAVNGSADRMVISGRLLSLEQSGCELALAEVLLKAALIEERGP